MLGIFLERVLLSLRGGLAVIFDYYFLWLPFFLGFLALEFWKRYVTTLALFEEEKTLIQIKLPRELHKSPKAMELFLRSLHRSGGEGNFYDKWWKGGTRPWSSLELVSIDGEVRFYIWTRRKYAKSIDTELYSQFPDIEVVMDTPDYTRQINYGSEENTLFGTHYVLTKEDIYPIKTYIDFGLDQDPKEEFKVDPIASVIEFLSSVGRGEQIWIQIIIRAHKKKKQVSLFSKVKKIFEAPKKKKYKDWEKGAQEIINKLLDEVPKDEEGLAKGVVKQTKNKEKIIEALERSLGKPVFDTIIRGLYIARADVFNKSNVGGLLGVMGGYGADGLNSFKPDKKTDFDFPWQDLFGKRLKKKKKELFKAYVRRAGFETRYNVKDFILTVEEVATIFHLPGSIVSSPNLPRISSAKAQPPANLPL